MPRRSFTNEEFIDAVMKSYSWGGVFRELGLKVGGGQYIQFKKLAKDLNLDLSHMTGQAWSKNKKLGRKPRIATCDILIENSTYYNTSNLKKRLWEENLLSRECSRCKSTEWFGKTNHLQLDHVDGDRTNNLLSNLRILCANCHSLTETYCGKNRGV